MLIWIDVENASDKIQHILVMKIPQNVGIEENFLNSIQAMANSLLLNYI